MTKNKPPAKRNVLEKLNAFFGGKERWIFFGSLFFTALFGMLLFEPKVSIGGDDSMYINRAFNFLHKGDFPMFQGPLYPIFISLIMAVAGTKLLLFKVVSMLCYLGHQWLTFKLIKNQLPPFLLFVFFLLISTSAAMLFYSCSTYNEVFYLFIQSIFLYHFASAYIFSEHQNFNFKEDYKNILISGFLLLLLAITKNIGLVAVISVVIYFLFIKNWKMATAILVSFVIFMVAFNTLKSTFWDVQETQISNQLNALMTKVPYKQDSGQEDAYGFFMRLVNNSTVYLGYHFRNIFGLAANDSLKSYPFYTVLIYSIFFFGFFVALKKSRFWLFIGVFVASSLGATFIILQTFWLQERLIIVFTPVVLMFMLYSLNQLFGEKFKGFAGVLVLACFVSMAANLYRSVSKMPVQLEVMAKYLSGDRYYGFPQDWIYYLQMTKWVSGNLPESSYVACRKPGMAFIYSGGKDFYGIWKMPTDDPEVLYNKLKDAGVTHVIMASLRTNPDDPNSRIINTVRRYLSAVNKAYPGKLKLVHQIGEKWPTYLYELH